MKRRTVLAGIAIVLAFVVVIQVAAPRPGWEFYVLGAADGPLRGTPPAICGEQSPAQSLVLDPSLRLRVFDRPQGRMAPIVELTRDGTQLWCVEARTGDSTRVDSLRFDKIVRDWRGRPGIEGRVFGGVYGGEFTGWYLEKDGRLAEYWYGR